jgi:hypothetical protein
MLLRSSKLENSQEISSSRNKKFPKHQQVAKINSAKVRMRFLEVYLMIGM